jgi:hypothetical protein
MDQEQSFAVDSSYQTPPASIGMTPQTFSTATSLPHANTLFAEELISCFPQNDISNGMATPQSESSIVTPLLQEQDAMKQSITITVCRGFLSIDEELWRCQAQAFQLGAVCKVSSASLIYLYIWAEAERIACVQINLPPTPRENLDREKFGRPILLVEEYDLVIAGVFLIPVWACNRIPRDPRYIDLSHLCQGFEPICDAYSKYHKQLGQQVSLFGPCHYH